MRVGEAKRAGATGAAGKPVRRAAADDELFLKCAGCGKTLAALVAGGCVMKHAGRPSLWPCLPISIGCDHCGTIWNNPTLLPNAAQLARLETLLRRQAGVPVVPLDGGEPSE